VPQNDEGFFRWLVWREFRKEFPDAESEYDERISEELDVICGMHFESYFLVMRAIFKHCRDVGNEPRYAALPTGAFVLVSLESPLWIRSPTVFLWLGSSTLSERPLPDVDTDVDDP